MPVIELIGHQTRIDMTQPLLGVPERKLSLTFAAAEAYWILSGDNRVSSIAPYAPSIAQFSDNNVTFFGAYGPKVTNQLGYILHSLEQDQSTRQAVMNIWRECPSPSKDIPCTTNVQWLIRHGKIHCNVTMRSSDAWLGWPYDVFNFSCLSALIALKLNHRHIEVELGTLTLTAGSQHLYLKNRDKAMTCLQSERRIEYGALIPSTFIDDDHFMRHLQHVRDGFIPKNGFCHVLTLTA